MVKLCCKKECLLPTPFIHLRTHSAYSLLQGALRMEELIALAKQNQMPAVALTDSGNLFGALEFALAAAKEGIQPIMGITLMVGDGETEGPLVLLAQNETGFSNLLKLSSEAFLEGDDPHHPTRHLEELKGHTEGLIALTGGAKGLLAQHCAHKRQVRAGKLVATLKTLFHERLYIELERHGLEEERAVEEALMALAMKEEIPLVATNSAMFATRDMHMAHDALICIASGRYVSEEERPRYTKEHFFKPDRQLRALFADVPEAVENTAVIAQRCAFMPESHAPMLPRCYQESEQSEADILKQEALEGLTLRLKQQVFPEQERVLGKALSEAEKEELAKPYRAQLDYELGVITQMDFPGYFLIVSDFIRWSKRQHIPVGPGRGSGAGSVVAWVLQITDLDPRRFGLLFERFLNPERVSMPDFDIDFCQERRDEVIAYVQEKYGKDRVAQIITFGKLQARAVLRDVGRVLQMSYNQVDGICKLIPFNPANPITLQEAIDLDPELKRAGKEDEQIAQLLDIGLKLEGLYRHASTHAAGVVIGRDPLMEHIPLYTDHRSAIPTTQYSMKYSEMAGLVKFDFLGLKTLTIIDKACQLIRASGQEIDIAQIPLDDPATYAMLTRGESVGVFQMESAGMRDALRKMRPDSIDDLIALISLYRPGPMENIPTYIARKHGKEKPDYLHPKLEPILKETYGVMIYQEQVMQIAQVLSGYSLGGADLLRRAMGKKIKAEMDAQRAQFVEGAVQHGVGKAQASSIFDLVAKFAGYGFNKSHAAAYALIGYQTAWLKANHPVAFLTACMNLDIGDTDKLQVFKDEASRQQIVMLPPDVQHSRAHFAVEDMSKEQQEAHNTPHQKAIRYALGALKGVGLTAMEALVQEREQEGAFASLADMAWRVGAKSINKRQMEGLAKAGALDGFGHVRRQVFEGAQTIARYAQSADEERASKQTSLFSAEDGSSVAPPLPLPPLEPWPLKEALQHEWEAIGFYLNRHPLDAYRLELGSTGIRMIQDLEKSSVKGSGAAQVAGMAHKVNYRSAGHRRFGYLYLSDPTGTLEIGLFEENLLQEIRPLLETRQPLHVQTEVRRDEGGIRLVAEKIQLLDDWLATQSPVYKVTLEADGSPDYLKALATLQATLAQAERGTLAVQLQVHIAKQGRVVLEVPGRYRLAAIA